MQCGGAARASRGGRARSRKDSFRLHDLGERFAQRREVVVRDPGMGFSRGRPHFEPGLRLNCEGHFRRKI